MTSFDLFSFSNDHHVLRRDAFDEDAYLQAAEAIPALSQLEDAWAAKTKYGRQLVEDVHSSLFKQDPQIQDGLSPTLQQHRELLETLFATTEYQAWHQQTQFNHTRSALGTVELAKALQDKLPADPDERRRVLRQRLREAADEVDAQLEAYQSLLGLPGEPGLTDLADVASAGAALARSAKLRRIMEYAGRFRRIALTKHKARVRHGPDEIVDVELGQDLSRVLPDELALACDFNAHGPLAKIFQLRYAERKLLQYRIDGREPLGRGPIVVCLDSSASMQSDGREFWAKGIALGLLTLATEERRDFTLLTFGSERQLREFSLIGTGKAGTKAGTKAGAVDLTHVIQALEFSFNGGTNFETPLTRAMELVESSRHKGADVIFLTDGEAYLSGDTQRRIQAQKQAKGARIFTVLIGFESRSLQPISDGIERLDDLADDEAVTDLVFGGL